ncbi:MAG: TetR/AcrR family transcriptional regulator [Bacteroidales bacterium]
MDYKQRIIEEAAFMFRTYGIRAVTMDMLANNIGISKRTIYEVFKDKDELLGGVFIWMATMQKDLIKKVFNESENVIEAIFKMLDKMRDHFLTVSPAFQMDIRRSYQDILKTLGEQEIPYYASNSEILKRGIAEGIFRDDINIEITNKCLLEVARISNDKNVFPPEDFMSRDVIRSFFINYLRGISTQKGLDLIDHYEKSDQKLQ